MTSLLIVIEILYILNNFLYEIFNLSSLTKLKIFLQIIYLGKPDGPTCHTGSETRYFTSINDLLKEQEVEENNLALTTLYSLESTISQRESELAGQHGKPSWTK
ncbi:hypothetical protein PTKIN_Ptkin04bG0108600 [Pterospermum kingtungense]